MLMGMAVVADWGKLGRIVVAVRAGGGECFAWRHLGHLLGGPASLNIVLRLLRIPSLNNKCAKIIKKSLYLNIVLRLLRIPSLNTNCAKIINKKSLSEYCAKIIKNSISECQLC